MTWLIVEDDPDIRNFVQMVVTVWGEKPLPFPDGRTAWAWLDSVENGTYQGELPELALMDIRMPGYTGDEIAARIRQTEALKHIPIILMTAFTLSESEVAEMQKRAGFDHLINKPLPELDRLQQLLYSVRDRRKAQSGAAQAAAAAEGPAEPKPIKIKVSSKRKTGTHAKPSTPSKSETKP
ncbi:MAG: response regulator [Chloroflexota bacterium]|nr:MAG: response regulator [Chloroflexota bacterium]